MTYHVDAAFLAALIVIYFSKDSGKRFRRNDYRRRQRRVHDMYTWCAERNLIGNFLILKTLQFRKIAMTLRFCVTL